MYCNKILLLVFVLFSISTHCTCDEYKVTDQVYFDIESEGKYIGRILIGLFGEDVPKTVKNFKRIATRGIDGKSYNGTRFHRVIRRFMIQGGDIVNNDGTGSISIYGDHFEDENFIVKHNGAGIVSMANTGPNTNGCQFFITTMAAPFLDGHHTVFGKVLKGQDIVHRIELMKTDVNDRPVNDVIIKKSAAIKTIPFFEPDTNYELSLWAWIKAGWFPLGFSFLILGFFHYIMTQLNSLKSFN